MIILFNLYFKVVFHSHQCRCETNLTLEENFMWTKSKNDRTVYEYQKLKYLITIKDLKIFCILFFISRYNFPNDKLDLHMHCLKLRHRISVYLFRTREYIKKNLFLNSSSFGHVLLFFLGGGVKTIWRRQIEVFITMNYKDIY